MQGKRVSESRTVTTQSVFPNDTNNQGTLYGGRLLDWIDMLGGVVAKRHSQRSIVTASIDSLNFLNVIHQRDIVTLEAWVNYVGRTSMEVEVRATAENPINGEIRKTCRAFLTFVAIDDEGNPCQVSPLIIETEEEKKRFEQAKQRRDARLKRLDLEPIEW